MEEDSIIQFEKQSALVAFTSTEGLDPFVDEVRKIVESFEHDLSTGSGRKKTASLAAKVSKFKVSLDDMGKGLTEEWKQKSKVVDNARKKMRDQLDALRDEARKPLTDWENAEKQRVDNIRAAINDIQRVDFEGIADLSERISVISEMVIDDSYAEFKAEAYESKEKVLNALKSMLEKEQQSEAQRLELERLRAESEARAKADREEALRKEGEERARKEAEAKIKAEQARIEAEAKAKEEESQRAELAARRAQEEAERKQREAEERAKMADENARKKAEADARLKEEEIARREANAKHNKKIKTEAKKCLIELGLDEKMAIAVVIAIDEKKIKNVSIAY
jgi:hypothetical protein